MTQRKLLRQTHNIMAAPKKKLGLLPKLIIAIVLGLIIGTIARSANLPIIIRIGATFNSIFGNFQFRNLNLRIWGICRQGFFSALKYTKFRCCGFRRSICIR